MAVARLALSLFFDNRPIRYTIIRRGNARDKYNTVTATLFTGAIYGILEYNKTIGLTDLVNSDSSNPKLR